MRRLALVLVLIVPASCARAPVLATTSLTFTAGHTLVQLGPLEVADTEATREHGLMGRASLLPGHGMVFVWPDVRARQFWMKGTLIPLDLISIRDNHVVGIQGMTPCRADPCPTTTTPPAALCIEFPAGTAEEFGIRVGLPVGITLP